MTNGVRKKKQYIGSMVCNHYRIWFKIFFHNFKFTCEEGVLNDIILNLY